MSVRRLRGTCSFPAGGQIKRRANASPHLRHVRLLAAVLASAVWVAWWFATPRLAPRTACLLWLTALALWLAALFTRWTIPRWHRVTTSLTVIVALSVLPRALWLASAPYKVEQDEVVIPLYGLKVLRSQPWGIVRGASAYFATPYLTHVLQGWPCLFAPPLLGARAASLLLAIASLVATYALAGRLFGRQTAVLAATLLACSWWHMTYARTAFPYMQPILMLPLALHVLVYGIEEDHRFLHFLGGILLGVRRRQEITFTVCGDG
jgi:Dolichyl-phosphate-mannose-protein mannosyltransferase